MQRAGENPLPYTTPVHQATSNHGAAIQHRPSPSSTTSRRPSLPQTTAPARTHSDAPPSSVASLLGHEHQRHRSSSPARCHTPPSVALYAPLLPCS
ncbi:hypothetical protein U1Q18_041443, partial [Sarracenia purpurea var. burkii]